MYNSSALIKKQIMAAGVEVQEPLALNSTAVRVAWDVARNIQYITVQQKLRKTNKTN